MTVHSHSVVSFVRLWTWMTHYISPRELHSIASVLFTAHFVPSFNAILFCYFAISQFCVCVLFSYFSIELSR
jgi:hypothetical protein